VLRGNDWLAASRWGIAAKSRAEINAERRDLFFFMWVGLYAG
jgi:hypothetical protein